MTLPKPRDKFWVTDPPATFDDTEEGGVALVCVFTSRRKLQNFYEAQDMVPELAKKDILTRRFLKLRTDCERMQKTRGWKGIAIDPDPVTGQARIIRFDGHEGIDAAPPPEPVEGAEPKKKKLPPPRTGSIISSVSLYSSKD